MQSLFFHRDFQGILDGPDALPIDVMTAIEFARFERVAEYDVWKFVGYAKVEPLAEAT